MGLVGNLEDLGLGELLQIVGMSGKTGVLAVRSGEHQGEVVFHDGRVQGAWLLDGPADLHALLAAEGALSETDLDGCTGEARRLRCSLESVLTGCGILDAEAIETLRRHHVEEVLQEMFGWSTGDFQFDTSDRQPLPDSDLLLANGLSAQFLALECTRLRDEAQLGPERPAGAGDAKRDSERGRGAIAVPVREFGGGEERVPVVPRAPAAAPRATGTGTAAPSRIRAESERPVIVIDSNLAVLEWVRGALSGLYERVHIFQRSELGIARIRQYLVRSELPLVILAADAPPDPLSGASDGLAIAERLHLQAPRMPLMLLAEKEDEGAAGPNGPSIARKPRNALLGDPGASDRCASMAEALRRIVAESSGSAGLG
jgi:hypothetical protein